jgi:hypothetical protein
LAEKTSSLGRIAGFAAVTASAATSMLSALSNAEDALAKGHSKRHSMAATHAASRRHVENGE